MTETLTFLDRPGIRGVKRFRHGRRGGELNISQSKINLHAVLPNKPEGTTELECIVLSSRRA